MIRNDAGTRVHALIAMAAFLAVADRAMACAVCFGDPNSSMAKGATAGVLVLLGVIGVVLAGFVGTGLFWMQRNRRLVANESASSSQDSADRRDA